MTTTKLTNEWRVVARNRGAEMAEMFTIKADNRDDANWIAARCLPYWVIEGIYQVVEVSE